MADETESDGELLTTRDGLVVRHRSVASEFAAELWADLARESESSRLWPVVIGESSIPGDDLFERFVRDGADAFARPASVILAAADALDAQDVFDRRWQDVIPIDDGDEPEAFESLDESMPTEPVGSIPARLVRSTGPVTIALVPAIKGEDVLAVLGWGDWNDCPKPEEHVAILRYWRERHGAQLRAMSRDTLELAVEGPPTSFDDALLLARQQYGYAPDIVDQGEFPSIGALAAALVGGRRWHFWWD